MIAKIRIPHQLSTASRWDEIKIKEKNFIYFFFFKKMGHLFLLFFPIINCIYSACTPWMMQDSVEGPPTVDFKHPPNHRLPALLSKEDHKRCWRTKRLYSVLIEDYNLSSRVVGLNFCNVVPIIYWSKKKCSNCCFYFSIIKEKYRLKSRDGFKGYTL